MLKGKTTIELRNVHTGSREIIEEENMVTNAIRDILNTNVAGLLYNNVQFNGSNGDDWMLPIYTNLTGGVLLYQNPIEENPDTLYAPMNNPLIGYASNDANNTQDTRRGSRNLTESKVIQGGYKYVWDFQTSQANGQISEISLTNVLAGRGCKYENNYFKSLTSKMGYAVARTAENYKHYRKNSRLYIEEGYRLECLGRNNETTVTVSKYEEEWLHARLIVKPSQTLFGNAVEEISAELNHYPEWNHYIDGERKDEDEPRTNNGDYVAKWYHGADGKWYGISRRWILKKSRTSGGHDYYRDEYWEGYIDVIDGEKCTTTKLTLPSGLTEFYSFGMSGKWLMCIDQNNAVYRLDTTNFSNLQVVSGVSRTCKNYIADMNFNFDDECCIGGYIFHDGKPVEYFNDIYVQDSLQNDGVSRMSRCKTYTIRTAMYNGYSSDYRKYMRLYLYTPYLATINNLSQPIEKTAAQTMKITYTLTEEGD